MRFLKEIPDSLLKQPHTHMLLKFTVCVLDKRCLSIKSLFRSRRRQSRSTHSLYCLTFFNFEEEQQQQLQKGLNENLKKEKKRN